MKRTLTGFVVGVCVGGAAVYLAWGRGETASPTATMPGGTNAPGATSAGSVTPGSARDAPARVVATDREAAGPQATDPAPPSPDSDASPSQSSLEIPGGKRGAQRFGEIAPLEKLVDSMSVYCTFDAGAGGQWPHGKLLAHGAAWQGGPLEFDSINLVEHTAQLTRHPWAIADDPTTLWVTATDTGLHFSGFKPDGELLATTVFGALDSEGRYRSVLSLHGARLDHESAQFYGWCSVR